MKYCTSMCCFGHKDVFVGSDEQWSGTCENYYFKKVELNKMEWCYWEEVKNTCGNCKKRDCFTCERWEIITDKLKFNHEVNRYGFQPALFRVHFYNHPGQICPFVVETVGVVKSRTIADGQFFDPGNIIITSCLT